MEVELRMRNIRKASLTVESSPTTVKCRSSGGISTAYYPTINASSFFAESLEIYPDRFIDPDDDQMGLVYYVGQPPRDYFYKPYKVYKLKRPYKLVDGTKKMTYSYYLPIPSRMLVDLGIGKGMPKLVTVTGAYLEDGQKVILIQKRRGPTN